MKQGVVSRTAMLIAAAQILVSKDTVIGRLVTPTALAISEQVLSLTGWRGKVMRELIQRKWGRLILKCLDGLLLPGLPAHFVLRKHCISELIQAHLVKPNQTLWVIAAGFDALGFLTAKQQPQQSVCEIDFPATQALKQQCLVALEAPKNLTFLAADLSAITLSQVIEGTPHKCEQAQSGVVVIEGLTMYLQEDAVIQLLADAKRLAGAEGIVVCTFMSPMSNNQIAFHNASWLVKHLLSRWREPFTWGCSKADFSDHGLRIGYQSVDFYSTHAMTTQVGYHQVVASGEVIAVLKV